MNLNSTKMVSCPALTDNSWPDLKELVEFIFLKEQLVKRKSATSSTVLELGSQKKFTGLPEGIND